MSNELKEKYGELLQELNVQQLQKLNAIIAVSMVWDRDLTVIETLAVESIRREDLHFFEGNDRIKQIIIKIVTQPLESRRAKAEEFMVFLSNYIVSRVAEDKEFKVSIEIADLLKEGWFLVVEKIAQYDKNHRCIGYSTKILIAAKTERFAMQFAMIRKEEMEWQEDIKVEVLHPQPEKQG